MCLVHTQEDWSWMLVSPLPQTSPLLLWDRPGSIEFLLGCLSLSLPMNSGVTGTRGCTQLFCGCWVFNLWLLTPWIISAALYVSNSNHDHEWSFRINRRETCLCSQEWGTGRCEEDLGRVMLWNGHHVTRTLQRTWFLPVPREKRYVLWLFSIPNSHWERPVKTQIC